MAHQFRPRHAFLAFGLTALSLFAQFLVRMVMTSTLGAGAAYDAFLLAMMPAALMATVGFQAMAAALVPRISDQLVAGNIPAARQLFRNASLATFAFWSVIGVVIIGWTCFFSSESGRYGKNLPLIMTGVIGGWGLIMGWTILQGQLLIYFGRFAVSCLANMLPAVFMLARAMIAPAPQVMDFVIYGLAGQALSLAIQTYAARVGWRKWAPEKTDYGTMQSVRDGSTPLIAAPAIVQLAIASLPIFLASFNAQASGLIDQSFAAWWKVGGLAILGAALAVVRLPQTLADSVMISTSYGMMTHAVSQVKLCNDPAHRARMSFVFRHLVNLQCFIVLPAAAFTLVYHESIAEFLYMRGKFGPDDAQRTGAILAWYSLCAPGQLMQGVQVPILVALGRASVALRYEILLTVMSAVLDYALLPFFDLPGIVISTGISVSVAGLFIYRALCRMNVGIAYGDIWLAAARPFGALLATLVAGLAALLVMKLSSPGIGAFWKMFIGGGVMACVFYGLMWLYPPQRMASSGHHVTMEVAP
ncbi:MAG: lipid II flippase MurJ [bacterium]